MAFDVASLVAVWAAAWCRASKWVAMVVVGVGSAAQGADRMDFTENFPCGCDSVVSTETATPPTQIRREIPTTIPLPTSANTSPPTRRHTQKPHATTTDTSDNTNSTESTAPSLPRHSGPHRLTTGLQTGQPPNQDTPMTESKTTRNGPTTPTCGRATCEGTH